MLKFNCLNRRNWIIEIILLLTISTCLTIGNGNYVTGASVESFKDKADEILQIAGERNPSSLDIPEDFDKERMDYTREMLRLDSLPSFGLVSADILPDFLDSLTKDLVIELHRETSLKILATQLYLNHYFIAVRLYKLDLRILYTNLNYSR